MNNSGNFDTPATRAPTDEQCPACKEPGHFGPCAPELPRNSLGQFTTWCPECGVDPAEPSGVCLVCEEAHERVAARIKAEEADECRGDYLYDQMRDDAMTGDR